MQYRCKQYQTVKCKEDGIHPILNAKLILHDAVQEMMGTGSHSF